MSTSAVRLPIVRDAFLIGYAPQHEWNWLIAAALFFGKVGAGLFVLSYFIDLHVGLLVGLLIVGVGKTTAHLLFLGRPERFLRAAARWRSSRLSQGIILLGSFMISGAAYVAASGVVHDVFGVAAVATAAVLMIWEGFVLKASRGVPFWESWLVPALALLYSLLGGTTLVLLLRSVGSAATETQLEWMQLTLLVVNLVLVGLYVLTSQVRSAAAEFAASLLTRGPLGIVFLAVAVGVGLVGTLALASVAVATGSEAAFAAAAVTDLLGHFLVFFAILRAGVHAPLRPAPARVTPEAAFRLPAAGQPS